MKLILFVLALLLTVSNATAQLLSYGLTDRDLRIVKALSDIAVNRSSSTIAANRELEAAKLAESLAQRLIQNTNLSLSGASGNLVNLPSGQVTPSFSVSVSVNVSGLVKAEPSRIPELEAKAKEAEARVRSDVLRAYNVFWLGQSEATQRADELDTAATELKQAEARFKANTITLADLARARDRQASAANSLRLANTRILENRNDLMRVCLVTNAEFEKILKETK